MLKDKELKVSKGSMQKVDVVCDYCGCEYSQVNLTRTRGHKIIEKDACKQCLTKKRKESCMVKYGVEVASKATSVKRKTSSTRGKGGLAVEDFHDQIVELVKAEKNISINYIADKFGLHRSSVKTYCEKIGLELSGDNQAKMQRTMHERYGAAHVMQSQELKEKVLDSINKTYSDADKKSEIISKIKAKMLEKYGTDDILNKSDKQEELQKKRRRTRVKNGNEVEFEGQTAKQIAKKLGISIYTFHERVRKWGLVPACTIEKHQTDIEIPISYMLKENNIAYKTQHYVDGKIADFYIPENNLLIEADGLYWHSEAVIKDKYHHFNRRLHFLKHGLTPLFFRGNEIDSKFPIVRSIILNKLNRSTQLGARKCKIIQIPKEAAREFFSENHLMGSGKGTTFALSHNNTIFSALQLKSIDKENKQYEISRFCNKLNYSVIGGFSRLLSCILKNIDISSLITYTDLRYGLGDYLKDFGFTSSQPHLSFKWTDGRQIFSRMKFPNNSGYVAGLCKLWDCGQQKHVLIRKIV
jgi:very-short-patch-repair endonuclease